MKPPWQRRRKRRYPFTETLAGWLARGGEVTRLDAPKRDEEPEAGVPMKVRRKRARQHQP